MAHVEVSSGFSSVSHPSTGLIFEVSGIQPLLIEELLKQNYQIGIYPSATIVNPPFAKILFSKVPDLRTHTEGKTVYDRDCRITADYLQALDTLGSGTKPFLFLSLL
ncbi:hypothetical protein NIB75_05375 [Bacteroides uniformis]|nr:hypothetical protein [Bacteroides uniformis]